MKNWKSVYFHKPFREKATFKEEQNYFSIIFPAIRHITNYYAQKKFIETICSIFQKFRAI